MKTLKVLLIILIIIAAFVGGYFACHYDLYGIIANFFAGLAK